MNRELSGSGRGSQGQMVSRRVKKDILWTRQGPEAFCCLGPEIWQTDECGKCLRVGIKWAVRIGSTLLQRSLALLQTISEETSRGWTSESTRRGVRTDLHDQDSEARSKNRSRNR